MAVPGFAVLLELRVRPCHILLGIDSVSISGSVASKLAAPGIHGCRKTPNKASTGISADVGKISINCEKVGRSADIRGRSCQFSTRSSDLLNKHCEDHTPVSKRGLLQDRVSNTAFISWHVHSSVSRTDTVPSVLGICLISNSIRNCRL